MLGLATRSGASDPHIAGPETVGTHVLADAWIDEGAMGGIAISACLPIESVGRLHLHALIVLDKTST